MPLMRVIATVQETRDAVTFVLQQLSGEPLDYRPGQFLTVRVPPDQGGGVARCYSLCTSPYDDAHPAITVKRIRDGHGSNWMCDHVQVGAELEILEPAGSFVPRSLDDDVLLVAGGSGITPMLSILTSILVSGHGRVLLFYANSDESSVIFRQRLDALVRSHPERLSVLHWLESVQGRPTAEAVSALLAPFADRDSYLCGPQPFMDVVTAGLEQLGAEKNRVHVERFVSLQGDPFAAPPEPVAEDGPRAALDVVLDGVETSLEWPPGSRLLDLLLANGIDAPFSCREGSCSACACVLTEGSVELAHNEVLDAQDLADGIILACQATPTTDRVRVTFDA